MKRILASALLMLVILFPVSVAAQVDPLEDVCTTNPNAVACQGDAERLEDNHIFGPNGILTKAARVVALITGVAAVIMIIVGGFQYVLASGDPTNITNAKNTILYAIIGLVVALIAQSIISFVLVRL
jgi:hypothetical protein